MSSPTYITFSNTPTDWTQLEGLYIDQEKAESQVVGAKVNTVGLFDTCVRGPTTPQEIASYGDFTALYGGRDNGGGGAITGKIWKALLNRKFSFPMVVCRVAASAAVAAHCHLSSSTPTEIITVTATSVGTWSNGATGGITVDVTAASDGDANKFNLVVHYLGTVKTYQNIDVHAAGTDNTTTVIGTRSLNLITVTKQADGRPINSTATSLAGGTEGTVAIADYEAALVKIAGHPKVRIVAVGCDVMVAEGDHATVNTYVNTHASEYPLTTFLMWSGDSTHTRGDEITAKQSALATPAGNIVWCYNATSTIDSTGTLIETGPHLDAAVILGNTDVAIHLGDEDNVPLLAGVKKVANESLARGDLILLRAAGISTLEMVDNGYKFHSAICADSVGAIGDDTARELVDYRRRAWLIESWYTGIKNDIAKAGTETKQRSVVAKLTNFAGEDQDAEHVIAKDSDTSLGYKFAFVQTKSEEGRNIFKLMCKARMIAYMLTIVMMVDVGTGTVIVNLEK